MKQGDRYDTAGLVESQYEPCSNGLVLKTCIAEMEIAETLAVLQATEKMLDRFDQKHRFTAADICSMHANLHK